MSTTKTSVPDVSSQFCESCGSRDWQPVSRTHGGEYVCCRRCRYHVRLADTSGGQTEHFEQEQQKCYGQDSFCMTQLFGEMQERRVRQRIAVVTHFMQEGKLLEVGPGTGEVLGRLASLGFNVTGIEHSPTLVDLMRQRYEFDVRVGTFEDQELGDTLFDAYLSFHVIEHVTDVTGHLHKAAQCVRPGGYAFIATPYADSWEHRVAGALSPNYSLVHLQLFSQESMTRLLEQTGWEVVEIQTPSYTDSWLRVASSLWRGFRGRRGGGGELVNRSDTPVRRGIIRVLGVLSLPIRLVQQAMRGGNELFVVARRKP